MWRMKKYVVTVTTGSVRTSLNDADLAALEARLVHARLYHHDYGARILLYAHNEQHAGEIVDAALRALPQSVPQLGVTQVSTVGQRRRRAA
jgi:hypothetical protein